MNSWEVFEGRSLGGKIQLRLVKKMSNWAMLSLWMDLYIREFIEGLGKSKKMGLTLKDLVS